MKRWILAALLFLCSSNLDLAGAQQKTADAKIIIGLARTSMSMLPVFLAQDKGLFREEDSSRSWCLSAAAFRCGRWRRAKSIIAPRPRPCCGRRCRAAA
jgi:hypothetical protein